MSCLLDSTGKNTGCLKFLTLLIWAIVLLCQVRPCYALTMNLDSQESWRKSVDNKIQPGMALIERAETKLIQGRFSEAHMLAKHALSYNVKSVKAHAVMGTFYALTGQKENARKELVIVQADDNRSFYSQLIRTILKAQDGKFDQAEQMIISTGKMQPDHPVVNYYAGSISFARGKLDKAEDLLQKVIQSEQEFSPALAVLAQIYIARQNMSKAAEYYEKVLEIEPENIVYRKQLVEIYRKEGLNEAVNKHLKETLYYAPGVKQNHLKKGMQLLTLGFYNDAVMLMDKALSVYRDIPEAYYIRAAARINLNDPEAAMPDLEKYLADRYMLPIAHHSAGMCYLAAGRIDKANDQFHAAISLNPNSGKSFIPLVITEYLDGNSDHALKGLHLTLSQGEPPELIHFLIAHILLARSDLPGYAEEMRKAEKLIPGLDDHTKPLIPDSVEARSSFANQRILLTLFFYNAWYGKTIEQADNLIKRNKKDIFAWYFKALSENAQNKTNTALKSFEELLALDADLLAGNMGLARISQKTGDLDRAVKVYKRVLAKTPGYLSALMALGDIAMQKRNESAAINYYKQVLAQNPEFSPVCQRLAVLLAEKQDSLDNAMDLAGRAVKLNPQDPYSLDALGWVYIKQGKTKKGIQQLQKALKLLPRNTMILYHLGIAYYEDNNLPAAKKVLEDALNISDNFRGALRAKEILEKIS